MELQCPIENDQSDTSEKKQNIKHLPKCFFFALFWKEVYCSAAYPIQLVQTTLSYDHAYSIVIGTVSRELHHPDDSKIFNFSDVLQVQSVLK